MGMRNSGKHALEQGSEITFTKVMRSTLPNDVQLGAEDSAAMYKSFVRAIGREIARALALPSSMIEQHAPIDAAFNWKDDVSPMWSVKAPFACAPISAYPNPFLAIANDSPAAPPPSPAVQLRASLDEHFGHTDPWPPW
ncbi:MAG: hypothetical protein V4617_15040 [Gemmatimonadota bacterium]